MYEFGHSVPQDYVTAHMWFNLAASHEADASVRNKYIDLREVVASKMTPDQIAEAQKMARKWKPK